MWVVRMCFGIATSDRFDIRWARALGLELGQTSQRFVHFKPGCSRISAIVLRVPGGTASLSITP